MDRSQISSQIESYFDRLWPLLRSITGEGVRSSHDILHELMPLKRIEIPSGARIFDWEVPKEWVVREAYVLTPDGDRILDVFENNLHLLNYSVPFRGVLHKAELEKHLYSKPELPDAIPYVTSYYAPRWGFCISENQRQQLPEGRYQVVVDTDLIEGSMTLSETLLPGEEKSEILLTSYTCHPSLANDELSGPLVLGFLYQAISRWTERRLSYRFVMHPETIGSLAYLQKNGEHLRENMVAGYVVTNVGVNQPFRYKRSRRGSSLADRAAEYAFAVWGGNDQRVVDFEPFGSDERQYCSPGFDLPMGVISRTPDYYPEYHTSKDNKDFIDFDSMLDSVDLIERVCRVLDQNLIYQNLKPYGEPQLGKYDLYPTISLGDAVDEQVRTLLWILNQSDGSNDLLAIAKRSSIPLDVLARVAKLANSVGILERCR